MCSRYTLSYNTRGRPFVSSFGPKEEKLYYTSARCKSFGPVRNKIYATTSKDAKTSKNRKSLSKMTNCASSPREPSSF
ncbi:hypothetical protein TNCV_1792901 [Trichonephila clavipes]|nr:hypothetical protein TNCV_1792901 [Trichonephila clavipes]